MAELGRSGRRLAASEAFFCAAIVSLSDIRPAKGAARGLGAALGPTLVVNDVPAVVELGLLGSFSSSCFDLTSNVVMILGWLVNGTIS